MAHCGTRIFHDKRWTSAGTERAAALRMPVRNLHCRFFALGFASWALGCGGSVEGVGVGNQGGAGTGGDVSSGGATANGGASASGGAVGECAKGPLSVAKGRPTSPGCNPSSVATFYPPDASAPCKADADCTGHFCVHGTCSVDACLVDGDCPAGSTCGCAADYYGGNGGHVNLCFPSPCRVDSDCGASGVCSPSFSGYCGALTGFYCHSTADTCNTDADCCGSTTACRYQPALGHWACQNTQVCSG